MHKQKIIHQWIHHLISGDDMPSPLLQLSNFIEDGMNLQQYWDYEYNNFKDLSAIFDLTTDFSVDIIASYHISSVKELNFIYILNHLQKIVCKMTITTEYINNQYKISSNGFLAQMVPKFSIVNNHIDTMSIAIKPCVSLIHIVSPNVALQSLSEGANFKEDGFYHAKFDIENNQQLENKFYDFHLILQTPKGKVIEKRKVFFDNFKPELIPYIIENNNLTLKNDSYPVNIAIFYKNHIENYVYPRDKMVVLDGVKQIIVTDSLDNDWTLILN